MPITIWLRDEVGDNQEARQELKLIFSEAKFPFETPKPVRLIKRIVQLATNQNDLILDSFAGSGTTAHAVLDLNKEDGGNRKFILVEMEKHIAKNITAERVKRVARGYSYKTANDKTVKVAGLGGSFEYVELGPTLFSADGNINEKVSFEEMASYVYFTETLSNIDKGKIKGNFIGECNDTEYYLLFKEKGENVLNRAALKGIKKDEKCKVMYADKCLLGDEILEQYAIVFKQIPYQVRVY